MNMVVEADRVLVAIVMLGTTPAPVEIVNAGGVVVAVPAAVVDENVKLPPLSHRIAPRAVPEPTLNTNCAPVEEATVRGQ